MKRWHWITLSVAMLTAIALLTVLNKWWWAKRINAKFKLDNPLTKDGNFVRSQSLRSLITLYYHGVFVDGNLGVPQVAMPPATTT